MKRAGERGEGKWKRISWDEALTDIADAILDRLVHNAYKITLKGESMRKLRSHLTNNNVSEK